MENLKIALIQTSLYWENPIRNIEHFEALVTQIESVDLIVFPEMFSTGFTMRPDLFAEVENGLAFQWMQKTAKAKQMALVGSISTKNNLGQFVNRCYFVFPDGSFHFYDKRHLFRMGNEHLHYQSGDKKVIIDFKGWKILLQVCYDLRFPVFAKNIFNKTTKTWAYDLILYPANWPERRHYAWSSLLVARAIENQAFVAGLNRIGEDGNQVKHSGDSAVLNYLGEPIEKAQANEAKIIYAELNSLELKDYREKFPIGLDTDEFQIAGM
jgi:omega-amidase